MKFGERAGFEVEGLGLPLPAADPPVHDCNVVQDLAACKPYVYNGKLRSTEISFQIYSDPPCDFQTVAATFNAARALKTFVDGHSPGAGVRVSTSWDASTSQNHVTVAVDFLKVPNDMHYIFVGLVCPATFARGARLELAARGMEAEREGLANTKWKLGKRTIPDLQGTAYTIAVLVRFGAWWHLYPLRSSSPGVTSKLQLKDAWAAPNMVEFIDRCCFRAHDPERKRVVIRVVEGHNLAVKDVALFGKGSSDPFVVTKCGGLKEEYIHKERTLSPSWTVQEGAPHTLVNVIASDPRRFEVFMFDRDTRKPDDFMGCCAIEVAYTWQLPFGTHYMNVTLNRMDPKVLDHIKLTKGENVWRTYRSTKVKGFVTIEIEVSEETRIQ